MMLYYRLLNLVLALSLCYPTAKSQELSIFSGRDLWHTNDFCSFSLTGCDWNILNDGNFVTYAYHPNGEFWLILSDYLSPSSEIFNIYKLEISNCQFTKIYSFPLPRYWHRSSLSANIDYLGRIYFCSNQIDSVTLETTKFLTRISNPSNPVYENLFSYVNSDQFHEIHFQNGMVFMPDFNSPLIRVYDTSFVFQYNIATYKHISGLTSFSLGCDSIITYATHLNITTEEVFDSGPDSIIWLSLYDLETGILNPICSYDIGIKSAVVRLTSPLEFLTSDSECDLLIDLDRDNSTGLYPYDYQDSNSYCSKLEVPICDEDTYIHSSTPLDSIKLILTGILDKDFEKLIMQSTPPGISFSVENDSTYLITASNPTDSLYTRALRSILYQHDGVTRTGGIRTIIIQGFNSIKDGVKINSFIRIEKTIESQVFSTTCVLSEVDTIYSLFNNQIGCDSLVTTIISFIPGDTTSVSLHTCNPDEVDTVQYVYTNQFGCDSLVVEHISLYPLPMVDITVLSDYNGYSISCNDGNDGNISAQVNGQGPISYLWSNGFSTQSIKELSEGDYSITITDGNGCMVSDTIILDAPEEFRINFLVTKPKCFDNANGSIIVGQNGGIEPILYSINGSIYQSSNVFSDLGAGTYTISSTDANGCEITEIIWINVPLEFNVDLGSDQFLVEGDTTILKAIINVPLDSISNINWSGLNNSDCPGCLTQPVSPVITTTYSISITSSFGCTDNDSLTVFIEYDGEVYVPNIFTPNGDGINDLLYLNGSEGIEIIPYFQIFDRWGNIVYSITNVDTNSSVLAWDGKVNGKDLNPGVYAYRASIKFKDGKNIIKYGDITLIK